MKFRELRRILIDRGFQALPPTSGGSHRKFVRVDGRKKFVVTLAPHQWSDDIRPKTLASIIRQSGLPKSVFRK